MWDAIHLPTTSNSRIRMTLTISLQILSLERYTFSVHPHTMFFSLCKTYRLTYIYDYCDFFYNGCLKQKCDYCNWLFGSSIVIVICLCFLRYRCSSLPLTSAMHPRNPPDENINPDTGDNPESKSQKRKRQLKETKEVGFTWSSRSTALVDNPLRLSKKFKRTRLNSDRSFVIRSRQ